MSLKISIIHISFSYYIVTHNELGNCSTDFAIYLNICFTGLLKIQIFNFMPGLSMLEKDPYEFVQVN